MTEVDGTKSVPCGNLPTWDWKSGVPYTDKLSGPQIRRNYFDCGTYYFDGTFNVGKISQRYCTNIPCRQHVKCQELHSCVRIPILGGRGSSSNTRRFFNSLA